jgi:hypothetical protein
MAINLEELKGKSEAEAQRIVNEAKMIMRVTSRNGESYIVTRDYRRDRVNVKINKDRVYEASLG